MLCALCAALLLLAACRSGTGPAAESDYVLWFLADAASGHGPALAAEPYPAETAPGPEELMEALLAGPGQEGLASPFPGRVSLTGCDWDPERPGTLLIGLSEQYGDLTDISLTLADYCIVLTLSQVEGVETVEIRSEGHSANYRSHQLLAADEAVLRDELARPREETV